ncbi:type IV secretion system protein VirB6 [Anaplasma platys]|uniref:Type IV secretion system protein VirB6 n=1 Tax=Anaplasma platys TaxID=949 RepID=A0A858PXW6_9RICK|nr:type IV secretion system protein [Anaplasma platys]QJC27425.1 type IV secretion system protein VirB6 [Anaplasma platys]
MHRVLKAIPLLILFVISIPLASLAEVAQKTGPTGADDEHLVHYRHSEATNPRCAAVGMANDFGGGSIGAGLGMTLAGMIMQQFPNAVTIWVSRALIFGGMTAVSAGITAAAPYYLCNWSFVRHPVLRKKEKQGSGSSDLEYSTCENPVSPRGGNDAVKTQYLSENCNKEFANMEDYYNCLVQGSSAVGKLSLEDARRSEPLCSNQKFKSESKYAWPKNRVSSSEVIEVCYRYPLSDLAVAPFTLFALSFYQRSYTELLKDYSGYPRESTFGSPEMHRTKLSVSGAFYSSKADKYVKCGAMVAGQEITLFDATYRAVERGARLCVDAVKLSGVPLLLQPEIGCQLRPNSPPVPMCADSKPMKGGRRMESTSHGLNPSEIDKYDNSACYSCYVSEVCKGVAGLHSRSVFPVTSVIVGCVVDSLKNLLDPPEACRQQRTTGTNIGFLKVAQNKLKSTVMAALILALILFSIKAVLGGVQNASELYMTAIKFALVVYFTQGSAMSNAYEYLTKLSIGLSNIVLQAGGDNGICDFQSGDYEKEFLYLMPWDRLDCRVMFYLGSQLTGGTGTGVVLNVLLSAGLLIAAVLINAKVIICLVALFAVLMLVLTVIWTVYVFLLSFIALTVLTIISPLMIPMCLFQATKGFFDGWTRQLMTYALYPVILFAFLSLMFTVFDQIYFGDLKFKRGTPGTVRVTDQVVRQGASVAAVNQMVKPKIWFELKEDCDCDKRRDNLACMFDSVQFHSRPLFLGISVGEPEFKMQATAQIWTRLGVFVLVGFLFYHFLSSISYIAGELAGDPRAGGIGSGGMNPRAMAHRAAGLASSLRSQATAKVSDLGGRMGDAMKGGGSEGGDKVSGGSSGRRSPGSGGE